MKKKIKKVTPIRSNTLCERCEHGAPREKTIGCLLAGYGKPCFSFKKKAPKFKSVDTCKKCKHGLVNECGKIRCKDCEICDSEGVCECGKLSNGEECKYFKPIENEV